MDQLFFKNKNGKEPPNNQIEQPFSRTPIDSSGGINRKSLENSNFRKVTLISNNQAQIKVEVTFFQTELCNAKIKLFQC